jgi:hypothetical protein
VINQEAYEAANELEVSVKGLRKEVEGWRNHVDADSHFMLVELDRLIDLVRELKEKIIVDGLTNGGLSK